MPLDKLNKKLVHVGMEAVILRADRLAAKNDWNLEEAVVYLQYKDKDGNTIAVNTDLDMVHENRNCRLMYGPTKPEALVTDTVKTDIEKE